MREADAIGMDVVRSSLCNCVVNFLLEENYFLTAFELLHELLDDGRDAQAIRLKDFFSDSFQFPPEQISRFNSLKVADPQTLFEEKKMLQEKLAISQYELRLAHEDLLKVKAELQKSELPLIEANGENGDGLLNNLTDIERNKKDNSLSALGPLKEYERKDLNCAVKEYLLLAGYRLTAMTFFEEVSEENLENWSSSPASVTDALRKYYYQYLNSTENVAEEKLTMLKEIESLSNVNEKLNHDIELLLKNKELTEVEITSLTKSIDSLQKDVIDKDLQVRKLKNLVDAQRLQLNNCRSEITSLQTQVEGSLSRKDSLSNGSDHADPLCLDNREIVQVEQETLENPENEVSKYCLTQLDYSHEDFSNNSSVEKEKDACVLTGDFSCTPFNHDNTLSSASLKMGSETIQILSDTLPKIVPYVLINHHEELLPLIMYAIEFHPDSNTRDSLTHTLFNLIKRPDEQQR